MKKKYMIATILSALYPASVAAQLDVNTITPEVRADVDCFSAEAECVTESDLLGSLDLVTPENSLFYLLNATPETVVRPKPGEKLAVSYLPQITDAFGNEEYAIGFEINPGLYMLPERYRFSEALAALNGVRLTQAERYGQVGKLRSAQQLSRFSLSGAASQAVGDFKVSRYGFGIGYQYDSGDAFEALGTYAKCLEVEVKKNDATKKYQERSKKIRDSVKQDKFGPGDLSGSNLIELENIVEGMLGTDPELLELRKIAEQQGESCRKAQAPWNRDTYGLGAAAYYSDIELTSGNLTSMEQSAVQDMPDDAIGYGLWVSTAQQLGQNGQLTISGRYTNNSMRERNVDGESLAEMVDGWMVGGRFTYQLKDEKMKSGATKRALRGFIEAGYTEEEFGNIKDSFSQAGIGVEFQLQEDLFFQAVVGDTFDSQIDRSAYLNGQLKWSFSRAEAQ